MADLDPRSSVEHLTGGPEALFRIGDVGGDQDRVTMSMSTGTWTRYPDGRPAAGSIGVLIDDMFGLAVVARRPAGCWAVTTELTVDYCAPLPSDGSPLHAESEAVLVDATGGLGRGMVRTDAGVVVALGTQRLRFVPDLPADPQFSDLVDNGAEPAASIRELLGVHLDEAGVAHLPAGRVHANPVGNLHGGILLAAADLTAAHAVRSTRFPLETASINVVYLRPGPTDATITFVPTVAHRGRSLAVTHVEAVRPDGKLCGLARVTSHRAP